MNLERHNRVCIRSFKHAYRPINGSARTLNYFIKTSFRSSLAISTIYWLLTPNIVQREGEGGGESKLDSGFYEKIAVSQTLWPGVKAFKICLWVQSLHEMSVKSRDDMANQYGAPSVNLLFRPNLCLFVPYL